MHWLCAIFVAQPLSYLRETPSQTAGPYVHIGLIPHQAGFDIYERPFSNVLVSPETRGERVTGLARPKLSEYAPITALTAPLAPIIGDIAAMSVAHCDSAATNAPTT